MFAGVVAHLPNPLLPSLTGRGRAARIAVVAGMCCRRYCRFLADVAGKLTFGIGTDSVRAGIFRASGGNTVALKSADALAVFAGIIAGDVGGMRHTASTQASARGGRWRAVAGDAMQLCVEDV